MSRRSVQAGMSLMDVALESDGGVEELLVIAKENNLDVDYVFDNATEIEVSQEKSSQISQMLKEKDFCTGEIEKEDDEEIAWILENGYWEDEKVWIDEKYWRDE